MKRAIRDNSQSRPRRRLDGRVGLLGALYIAALVGSVACVSGRAETGGETNWLAACKKDPECDAGAAQAPDGGSRDDATQGGDDSAIASSDAGAAESAPELSPEQFENALTTAEEALKADTSGGAWRVIEVPTLANEPSVIQSPLGWLALSYDTLGDGKAIEGYKSVLYRSVDGVHWEQLALEGAEDVALRGLAYGNGKYVMTGRRLGATPVFWASTDAQRWTQTEQGVDSTDAYGDVEFVEGKFFALGMRYLAVSGDGESWSHVPVSNLQGQSIAYGNGQYVMVGSGPVQVSADGNTWQSVEVPCSLDGACMFDPGGAVFQGFHSTIVFAEGRFYTDQLSSLDGVEWQAAPWISPNISPTAYTSGWFLGGLAGGPNLQAWTLSAAPQPLHVIRPSQFAETAQGRSVTSIGVLDRDQDPPSNVDVSFEDELTCETASCLLVGSRLLLVPPGGQPALTDRTPRAADGLPLLSEDCPVSSQLFCDDYETRTGCVCDPEAPREPGYCGDVGKYACDGEFAPRAEEWPLDEVAQAGCNCDFDDPNEPATFGETCTPEDNPCLPPLECRGIPVESFAPSLPMFICTAECKEDVDCPSWTATGFCAGEVHLECLDGTCQPRACD